MHTLTHLCIEHYEYMYMHEKYSLEDIISMLTRCHARMVAKHSSLGRYVFGSEISYNKAPPRLPGLGC
jgi:hypothetical protein